MLTYIIRRLAYAIPILLGVNLLTFFLFFVVNSPDSMAEQALGKNYNQKSGTEWKENHGYNLPTVYNNKAKGIKKVTNTIFWKKSFRLFFFDFGKSDQSAEDISTQVKNRMIPSLYISIPVFILPLFFNVIIAMFVAYYRGTYIDISILLGCVLLMSISVLFYIIGGQFLLAKYLKLVPISGFDTGFASIKFLILPVIIGFIGAIGSGIRYNRTIFLEEINKDYVRTARSKGLSEGKVLYKHALKNAMIPILTSTVVMIPFLIMGNLILESFFSIPGLGSYTITAIQQTDFAIVRSMVFLGSCLYIFALILVDISYTIVDPRIRLG